MSSRLKWLLAAGLIAQTLLFHSYVAREVAWTYPVNWDQTSALTRAYTGFEEALSKGVLPSWFSIWVGHHAAENPNGILQPLQASIFFLLLGPSREAALCINLFYFLCWQIAAVFTVLFLTRRYEFALLAWGLILSLGSPFMSVSGMMDFRLDFSAMCLFGIWICIAIASGLFLDTRLAMLSAIPAALTILYRYMTSAYLATIFGGFLLLTLVLLFSAKPSSDRRVALMRRARNILISGFIVVVLTGPSLWVSRKAWMSYYLDTHLDRRVWGAGGSFFEGISIYIRALVVYHLGSTFFLSIAVLLLLGIMNLRKRQRILSSDHRAVLLDHLVFLLLCLGIPLIALSLYPSKQSGVAGILVPPVIGIGIAVAIWLAGPQSTSDRSRFTRGLLWALAASPLLFATYHQLTSWTKSFLPREHREDLRQIVEMYDQIGRFCEQMHWQSPRISTDYLDDYITEGAGVLVPVYYERHGWLFKVQHRLGAGVFHVTREEALADIRNSDVVLLTNDLSGPVPALPFNQDIRAIRPVLREEVIKSFALLGRHSIYGRDTEIYVRPAPLIQGISGDWITNDGIDLMLPAAVATCSAQIVLKGPSCSRESCGESSSEGLEVSSKLISGAGEILTSFPTEFHVDPMGYRIDIVLPDDLKLKPDMGMFHIQLSFSKYFVPAELGIGPDWRKLVLWKPTNTQIVFRNNCRLSLARDVAAM
jgi:hypothetical protein